MRVDRGFIGRYAILIPGVTDTLFCSMVMVDFFYYNLLYARERRLGLPATSALFAILRRVFEAAFGEGRAQVRGWCLYAMREGMCRRMVERRMLDCCCGGCQLG